MNASPRAIPLADVVQTSFTDAGSWYSMISQAVAAASVQSEASATETRLARANV
ncbi:MAG TPA: hypothetical protein VFP65_18805 [Anaeromyxobacteraceae bacterium]|nr:hypothetical protein [Anaeromyxobacteraceae bacterium]